MVWRRISLKNWDACHHNLRVLLRLVSFCHVFDVGYSNSSTEHQPNCATIKGVGKSSSFYFTVQCGVEVHNTSNVKNYFYKTPNYHTKMQMKDKMLENLKSPDLVQRIKKSSDRWRSLALRLLLPLWVQVSEKEVMHCCHWYSLSRNIFENHWCCVFLFCSYFDVSLLIAKLDKCNYAYLKYS